MFSALQCGNLAFLKAITCASFTDKVKYKTKIWLYLLIVWQVYRNLSHST